MAYSAFVTWLFLRRPEQGLADLHELRGQPLVDRLGVVFGLDEVVPERRGRGESQ